MKDLKDVRERVKNVIINSGHNPILAEDNIDFINNPEKAIEDMVDKSDAYIGIFDKRWGYEPPNNNPPEDIQEYIEGWDTNDKLFVTAIEYYYARKRGTPMLIFVSKSKKRDEKLKAFLDIIRDYHTGQWLHYYDNIDKLVTIIANTLPTMKDYHEKKIKFEANGFKMLHKDELTVEKAEEEFEKWKEGFELDFASIYHNYDYRRKIVEVIRS